MSYCKRKPLALAIKAAIGLPANCEPVMKSLDDRIAEAFYAAEVLNFEWFLKKNKLRFPVFSDEGIVMGWARHEIVARNMLACSDAFSD